MKHFIHTVLPLVGLLFSASVHAAPRPVPYQAVIRAELKAQFSEFYTDGSLFMDGRKASIKLGLQPKMPACAEDSLCIQEMPEPLVYQFENARTEVDSCGIIRTRALIDQRPVDGNAISIVVNNNRHNRCPTFVALAPLDVILGTEYYDRIKGEEVTIVETFVAKDFVAIKPCN
ncbi:MAG: hypothetical protein H7249_00225 [Chitinophagaceae bacterium]|nr:hypothetical protein [Oligoflexus sp.]